MMHFSCSNMERGI